MAFDLKKLLSRSSVYSLQGKSSQDVIPVPEKETVSEVVLPVVEQIHVPESVVEELPVAESIVEKVHVLESVVEEVPKKETIVESEPEIVLTSSDELHDEIGELPPKLSKSASITRKVSLDPLSD